MKPVSFPQSNKTLLPPESMSADECETLPVFSNDKYCISCWRPSLKERLSILIFGKVWLWVMSKYTQPPVAIDGARTVFLKES
jgi:hypothetical protein